MEQPSVPEPQGWLIDFDFGGKFGTTTYPKGYRNNLEDGDRLVDGEHEEEIQEWHDWYALGRLIFEIHVLHPPDLQNDDVREGQLQRISRTWQLRESNPTPKEIKGLRDFLHSLEEHGWTVRPKLGFKKVLEKLKTTDESTIATNPGATGSPPKLPR
jgi:hypothetical protein